MLIFPVSLQNLTRNQSAQVYLGPENVEEPYLEGVNSIHKLERGW